MKKLLIGGLMFLFIWPSFTLAENINVKDEYAFNFYINPIANSEEINIEMFLTNEGVIPLKFEFPTSQYYELTIEDSKGIVYQYSEGKFFLQAIQYISLQPGETKKWVENIKSDLFKPGPYKIKGQLKTISINEKSIINQNKLLSQKDMVVPEENPAFKEIIVKKENGVYHVKGKINPLNDSFYYLVEDGHHEWMPETKMVISKHPGWKEFAFDFKLSKDKFPKGLPLILYLYEKDESGRIIHSYPKLISK